MSTHAVTRAKLISELLRAALLVLISCAAAATALAQATVETGGLSSTSAGATAGVSKAVPKFMPKLPSDNTSANSSDPSATQRRALTDTENRKIFEDAAGKDAAKLQLDSVPAGALIYVDDRYVGHAPQQLILPPGNYSVEMRGLGGEVGEQSVDVAPNATQHLSLTLAPRHSGTFVVVASPSGAPAASSEASAAAAKQSTYAEETNRKTLERDAGKQPAKLTLLSVPADALIYVDGLFVGHAPQQLTLVPGKHKIEMRGDREGSSERLITLAPGETQELKLDLAPRYPSKVVAHD